jgi:hypothetical protein
VHPPNERELLLKHEVNSSGPQLEIVPARLSVTNKSATDQKLGADSLTENEAVNGSSGGQCPESVCRPEPAPTIVEVVQRPGEGDKEGNAGNLVRVRWPVYWKCHTNIIC